MFYSSMTFNPILNLLFLLQIISTSTSAKPNVLFIAIDDLRPQFGRSYHNTEVLAPNIDNFFLDNNGSSFQHAYVQIAVCGPSRASMLTGRRPDTTHTFHGEKGRPGNAGVVVRIVVTMQKILQIYFTLYRNIFTKKDI